MISTEVILQGLTGILILAWALKDARKARMEVAKAVSPVNPMVTAMSMAWDRDQQERLLQMVERIVVALEKSAASTSRVAGAQEVLANKQQVELQETMDEILERMKSMPAPR